MTQEAQRKTDELIKSFAKPINTGSVKPAPPDQPEQPGTENTAEKPSG